MDFLHTFFALNRSIIIFAYGLAFFVLGLAIALQSRRHSRLDLARSLPWLAAFGLAHGFFEWGDLFIPIQTAYLSPSAVAVLHNFHLLLLAISFACLFEFGASLLPPVGRARRLRGASAILIALWIVAAFLLLPVTAPEPSTWLNTANALARYWIGFPGALLAAYALRRQALSRIAPLNVPHIVNTLRVAGVALALYAILGGLITPPISFFPGTVVNADVIEQAIGVPLPVFRSLVGLMMAVAIIRALEVFDLETARLIEGMEQEQILAAERERLARELHDGVIQTVYTAGLLVESAQKIAPPESPLAARLQQAETALNDAILDLRRNLGELRTPPSGESLGGALRRVAEDLRFQSLVDISLDLALPETDSLSPARTDHVMAIVGESLSNVVRHARARQVSISVCHTEGRLVLTIRDDGVGLTPSHGDGYGLRNMRDRAHLLGGQLEVNGVSGEGTAVTLNIPWKDEA